MHSSNVSRSLRRASLVILTLVSPLVLGCSDEPTGPDGGALPNGTLYTGGTYGSMLKLDLGSRTGTSLTEGSDPYPTPDGTILYVRNGLGLYEGDATGAQVRRIVATNVQNSVMYDDLVTSPQLSPDGRFVAYSGESAEHHYGVVVVDRQTGELVAEVWGEQPHRGYARPTWTPDGRLVFAGAVDEQSGLYITDAGLTSFERLDENLNLPKQPRVSPDGKRIAFILANHVHTIGIDGSGLQQITTSNWQEAWPTWSPDGAWLAFHAGATTMFAKPGSSTVVDLEANISDSFDALALARRTDSQIEWR